MVDGLVMIIQQTKLQVLVALVQT
jgi:hypothetical protein